MDTDVNMKLNDFGRIVEHTWFDLVNHVRNIKLHAFIVMPNHIHGLIEIYNDIPVGAGSKPVRNNTPNAGRKNDIPNSPRNGVPHDGRNDSIIDEFTVGAGSKPARINTPNDDSTRTGLEPASTEHGKTKSISEIVRQFKTFSSRHINKSRNAPGNSVWQRNYHEHVVRNDKSYLKISGYIINNPAHWRRDKYFV